MSKWKVSYNKIPTSGNTERCLVIQAESRIEAIITAFHHLTEKGYCVGSGGALPLSNDDHKTLNARKVSFDGWRHGNTVITSVESFEVKPLGKVVES